MLIQNVYFQLEQSGKVLKQVAHTVSVDIL